MANPSLDMSSSQPRGSVTRVEARKREKVTAIFNAAEDLFLSRGYHATTIDEVARKAGVSVGSVYVYFGNKEGVCRALLDKALEVQERYLLEATEPGDDPETSLRKLGQAYLRFFLEHPAYFKLLMFLEHGGLGRDRPEGAPALNGHDLRAERLLQALASRIIEGIQQGQFEEVDAEGAARFLWGSWTGVIGLTARTGPTRARVEDLPRLLALGEDMVLNGLLRRRAE